MAFKLKSGNKTSFKEMGSSPAKHIGRGWTNKEGKFRPFGEVSDPVFHPHPHGSKGVGELMKEDVQKVAKHIGKGAKAVGKAGKWVGKGIKRGIKNIGKIRIKGGGRGGYEMGPGGKGGWRG